MINYTSKNISRKTIFWLFICSCFGILFGIILAVRLDPKNLQYIEVQLGAGFLKTFEQQNLFVQSVLKSGGIMFLIWIAAFFPLGDWIALIFMFIKSMGFGFTGMIIIKTYEGAGFLYTMTRLLPQAILFLAAAIFLCYINISGATDFRDLKNEITGKRMLEYFLALLFAELFVIITTLI